MSNKNENNKEEKTMYDVIIFTYKGDSVTVIPCIKSCLHTLGNDIGTILVVDDGFAPMLKRDRENVESLSKVKYIQSMWPRNGNLIGKDHQQGYLHLVKKCVEDGTFKSKVLIKIDPDTSIWKRDFLDEFYQDDKYLLVSSFKPQNLLIYYPMGNMYAWKLDKEVIDLSCKDVERIPDFFNSFEDYCLCARIVRAAQDLNKYDLLVYRYESGPRDGFLLVNPESPCDPKWIKDNCRIFCNGFGINQMNKAMQAELQVNLYKFMVGESQNVLREGQIFNPAMPQPQPHMMGKTGMSINPLNGQMIQASNPAKLTIDPTKILKQGTIK